MIHIITSHNRPELEIELNEAWVLSRETVVAPAVVKIQAGSVKTYGEDYPHGTPRVTWSAGTGEDGRIVDQSQWDTIDGWVKTGVKEGGELFQPHIQLPKKALFYPPTLICNLDPAASTVQEEIFGPVLVSLTFRTPAEAIALANNTRYGLAASVWSENINLALDVASKLKAGSVWVNCTNLFDAAAGFGGYRESGFGREGGREGLFEYVRPNWMPRPRPNFKPLAEDAQDKWGEHVPARPNLPSTERADGQKSLDYLNKIIQNLRTPLALAWGLLGLTSWNRRPENYRRLILETLERQEKYVTIRTCFPN